MYLPLLLCTINFLLNSHYFHVSANPLRKCSVCNDNALTMLASSSSSVVFTAGLRCIELLEKKSNYIRVFQDGCSRFQTQQCSCTAYLVLPWPKPQRTHLTIDGVVGKPTIMRKCVFLKHFHGNTFDKCLPAAEAGFRSRSN